MKLNVKKLQQGGINSYSYLNYKSQPHPFKFLSMEKKDYDYRQVLPVLDKFEGFKDHVYKDGNGIDTIGHGLTAKKYTSKGKITKEESLKGVEEHIKTEVLPYLKIKPYWNNLNDNQKTALISYVYNIGSTGFTKKSPSLQKALIEGDWEEAANQMDFGYNDIKNKGLRDRRNFERDLFLS